MKYLNVIQAQTLRWEYNKSIPSTLKIGLFTDGFYNCIIINMRGNVNGRISLTHADLRIDLSQIKEEEQWVGIGAKKIIYAKRNNDAQETIEDIFGTEKIYLNSFEIKWIEPLYQGSKPVVDHDKPLPDGSYLPEYQAGCVWIDNNRSIATKNFLPGLSSRDLIKDKEAILAIYKKMQKNNEQIHLWKEAKQHDLNSYKMTQTILDETPAMRATLFNYANEGNLQKIIQFLDNGYDINVKLQNGYTLLALVSAEGHHNCAVELLKRGADVNEPMDTGATPLHLAAGRGHLGIVQQLIAYNANPTIKTLEGRTAYDFATNMRFAEIAELLRQYEKNYRSPNNTNVTQNNNATTIESNKLYWVFATQRKEVKHTNIINNLTSLPNEKKPKFELNCFTTEAEAQNYLITLFSKKPIKKGGFVKGFIFKLNLTPITLSELHQQNKFSDFSQYFDDCISYRFDRDKQVIVAQHNEDTDYNIEMDNKPNVITKLSRP